MAVSRRSLLRTASAGGAAAVASTTALPVALAHGNPHHPRRGDLACDFALGSGGRKQVFLPPPGSTDPAVHSRNEVLFWSDQLREHGLFLAMLLPGTEATELRRKSLQFRDTFDGLFNRAQGRAFGRHEFRGLNRVAIELTKRFVDFKLTLEEGLRTGQIRGLIYPSFAAHVAAEGEHFINHLTDLNAGNIEQDLAEVIPFWARIMGEHAQFAAQLLDPGHEQPLIEQADALAARFQELASSGDAAALAAAGEMILDYKETAESGIESGEIQSIIHPALADHIRREAVKFLDELRQAMA
jgi:hypothetical protein